MTTQQLTVAPQAATVTAHGTTEDDIVVTPSPMWCLCEESGWGQEKMKRNQSERLKSYQKLASIFASLHIIIPRFKSAFTNRCNVCAVVGARQIAEKFIVAFRKFALLPRIDSGMAPLCKNNSCEQEELGKRDEIWTSGTRVPFGPWYGDEAWPQFCFEVTCKLSIMC